MIKRGLKPTKFCKHDHKDLVNMSTKEIEESLHVEGGIEKYRARTGFYQELEKLRLRGLVIPGILALG